MKKSIEKLKIKIDQNLSRAEKSELLCDDLLRIEEKAQSLRVVCQNVAKKLAESCSSNSGTRVSEGAAIDKRIRKTIDFTFGQVVQQNGRYLSRSITKDECSNAINSVLGCFLSESGRLLTDLAANHVQYEVEVEKLVLASLNNIVNSAVPAMNKGRRSLEKQVLDLDTIKSRLTNVSQRAKDTEEERLQEELRETQSKVEITRDNLAIMMLQFLSQEPQIANILLTYFKIKKEYHSNVADQISSQISSLETILRSSQIPVFGLDLVDHLRKCSRLIAIPIQLSVCRLIQLGLDEEGLFRLTAPHNKVKRMISLLDSGEWSTVPSLLLEVTDQHVFTGVLKAYMRELPQPLLAGEYSDWIKASDQSSHCARCETLRNLITSLPQENFDNLNYIFKFLNTVASRSEFNKMTLSNLSIVISPNILWDISETTSSLVDAAKISRIVELLIEQVEWFFDSEEIDFFDGLILSFGDNQNGGNEMSYSSKAIAPVPAPRGKVVKPCVPAKPIFATDNSKSDDRNTIANDV